MSYNKPTLFKNQIDGQKITIPRHRWIQAFLVIGALGFPAASLLNPGQSRGNHVWNFLLGISASVAGIAVIDMRKTEEKDFAAFNDMSVKHFQDKATQYFGLETAVNAMETEVKLAEHILKYPTDSMIGYFAEKMGILGMITATPVQEDADYIDVNSTDVTNNSVPDGTISRLQSHLNKIKGTQNIDLSWMDKQFIQDSKVVVGVKGQGKSVYLRYEAASWFNTQCQKDEPFLLIICDPHYDYNDPEKHWLADLDQQELYQTVIFQETEDCFKQIKSVYKELKRRKTIGQFDKVNDPRIKIIIDEGEVFKNELNAGDFALFIKAITAFQNEARKYKIDMTLGLHTLKKEQTGIDSSTLAQMHWLLFSNAAFDSTVKYPQDYDAKGVKEKMNELEIPRGLEARKVYVSRVDYDNPIVTLLPKISPEKITLESTVKNSVPNQSTQTLEPEQTHTPIVENPEDDDTENEVIKPNSTSIETENMFSPVDLLREECIKFKAEHGVYPTHEQIKQAWENASGEKLNDSALEYLISQLNLK